MKINTREEEVQEVGAFKEDNPIKNSPRKSDCPKKIVSLQTEVTPIFI